MKNNYTEANTLSEYILSDSCSKCGKCRSVCPTFIEDHNETKVARGRLHLISEYEKKNLPPSDNLKRLLSECLVCMQCTKVCPNQIDIEKIITQNRNRIRETYKKPILENLIFKYIIQRRRPLKLAAQMMGITSKFADLTNMNIIYRNLLRIANIEKNRKLPDFKLKSIFSYYKNKLIKSKSDKKGTILYFPGCSATLSLQNIAHSVIKILTKNGYDVIFPELGCCGLPVYISGDHKTAQNIAQNFIKEIKKYNCNTIITSCGSCGYMIKKIYKDMKIENSSEYTVYDICDFLVQKNISPGPNPIEIHVTYHDPCHLKNGLNIYKEPRKLLKEIKGITYSEMTNADSCCGSGGSFSLRNYKTSKKIRERKINMFLRTKAKVVATGCPACIMHIDDGFFEKKINAKVLHPVELIAESYKNQGE